MYVCLCDVCMYVSYVCVVRRSIDSNKTYDLPPSRKLMDLHTSVYASEASLAFNKSDGVFLRACLSCCGLLYNNNYTIKLIY